MLAIRATPSAAVTAGRDNSLEAGTSACSGTDQIRVLLLRGAVAVVVISAAERTLSFKESLLPWVCIWIRVAAVAGQNSVPARWRGTAKVRAGSSMGVHVRINEELSTCTRHALG